MSSVHPPRERGSGSPETYSHRAPRTIGLRGASVLLDVRSEGSVSLMRTSRVPFRRVSLFVLGFVLTAVPGASSAQAPAVATAKLIGTVTDTSGAPLSRAEIWLM